MSTFRALIKAANPDGDEDKEDEARDKKIEQENDAGAGDDDDDDEDHKDDLREAALTRSVSQVVREHLLRKNRTRP